MPDRTDRAGARRPVLRPALTAALALCLCVPTASAQGPLSASDWLDGGARHPPAREASGWRPGLAVPPDARLPSARDARPRPRPEPLDSPAPIAVSRLDGPDADGAGLAPAEELGLPPDFWADADLTAALAALEGPAPRLPVLAQAWRRSLVAQLAPPQRADAQEGQLALARVDALMALGAIDLAAALMDAMGAETVPLFARRMDAALLLGDERRACAMLAAHPGLAPSLAVRIYCLARGGDWAAAQLALFGARLNGGVEPAMLPLLAAFLDDAQVDAGVPLTPPEPMTPLAFRLLEASGQPLPTTALPLGYALADLRANTGWKPRVEAAERLARAGDLAPRQLRAIYAEQPPAASGGVWDRVGAVQQLEAALSQGEPGGIAPALLAAAEAMAEGGLGAGFAQMFGPALAPLTLPGEAGALARRLALASGEAEAWAALQRQPAPADAADRWLLALTTPEPLPEAGAPTEGLGATLAAGLRGPAASLQAGMPVGPAFLAALRDLDSGREGDMNRAARGLATLRGLGPEGEALARAAVLQLLLLPAADGGH